MTEMELELLMANLKSANLAQAAKKDLTDLFEEVKKKSMDAVFSDNHMEKDAAIMANMTLIGKLIKQEIMLIDQTQKVNMSITGIIANAAKKAEEDDSDSQGGGVVHG